MKSLFRRRPSFASLLVVGAFSLFACDSDDTPDPCEGVAPDSRECLTGTYLPPGAALSETCASVGQASTPIDREQEIRFFFNGTGTEALAQYGAGLRAFYDHYGLTFFTQTPPAPTDLAYVFSGTDEEMKALSKKVGLEAGKEPTKAQEKQLEKLMADMMFGPLRAFVESQPSNGHVAVVGIRTAASPALESSFDGVVGGVGISPKLFREVEGTNDLFTLMGLPQDFTPALFLAHDDIVRFGASKATIVAHEMGHALGLPHMESSGNVMRQGSSTQPCTPTLTEGQAASIRQGLTTEGMRESWKAAVIAHRRLVDRVLAPYRTNRQPRR